MSRASSRLGAVHVHQSRGTKRETRNLGSGTARAGGRCAIKDEDFIKTTVYNKCSGSTKFITHMNHMSHCKVSPGTNWSNVYGPTECLS